MAGMSVKGSARLFSLLLLSLPLCGGPAALAYAETPAAAVVAAPSRERARMNQRVFDTVWSEVRRGYYDPDLHGVDWGAARDRFRPQALAIERVLFQHNVSTAMSVGMVSGIVMAEAATVGCDVVEYSPNEVKESVAGWGGADKNEVGRMVQTLLDLPKLLAPADAADAVAVALCHLARVPARSSRTAAGGRR